MYHVEFPVDEPSWVTAAAGSLANLEVILLPIAQLYLDGFDSYLELD